VFWIYLAIAAIGGLGLAILLFFWALRWLGRREPYAGFIRLPNRRKLTFFRLLLADGRVPLYVKILPVLTLLYLASPIDLTPFVMLDDIALALLALVLIIKLTPRQVVADLVRQAAEHSTTPSVPAR
jgi:uncharacterized membrane protein YkvA (DUF1232 family)